MNVASYIDHTILKPETTPSEIEKLCSEARVYHFKAVCVPPYYIASAKQLLAGTAVNIATVIGFPFGYNCTDAKIAEIEKAVADGATELDVVHNIAAVQAGDWDYLQNEIKACTDLCHKHNTHIKVIVESGIRSQEELLKCCALYGPLHIDFMKTSTGYAKAGATVEAITTMRQNLPASVKLKASGGIRTFDFAKALIEAGADRLGCSASVSIVQEAGKIIV